VSFPVGIIIAIVLAAILVWLLNYAAGIGRPRAPGEVVTGAPAMERKVSLTLSMLIGTGLFFTGYSLLYEPAREAAARERQQKDSIERGIATFTTLCYPCHGNGTGAVVPGDPDKRVAPALNRPDFQVTGADLDTQRQVYTFLSNTIHRGRPGTPMPAWGKLDGGTLLDEQIHELVLLIMFGDRKMSAQIQVQTSPGIHQYEVVDGTPWEIVQKQLDDLYKEGAPTPIPKESLLGNPAAPGAAGRAAFVKYGCGGCHTVQGLAGAAGKVGPELTHIGTEAATMKPGMAANDYLVESIREPSAFITPGFTNDMPKLPVTDQELKDLVDWLSTLK